MSAPTASSSPSPTNEVFPISTKSRFPPPPLLLLLYLFIYF